MTEIFGLTGLRPGPGYAKTVTCPPYDVIKPGTVLERCLSKNLQSLYHVVLGDKPQQSLQNLIDQGALINDEDSAFYVYEQSYGNQRRIGLLTAVAVTPYEKKEIIRHEKTFEEKVLGRIDLMKKTGYVTEPVWLLTRAKIRQYMEEVVASQSPIYEFKSDFDNASELHGISNRIYKVLADSDTGRQWIKAIGKQPLYIADGHHRYHSALTMGLKSCIAYICEAEDAQIQAYNRVIRGKVPFKDIKDQLPLKKEEVFKTPEKHQFMTYSKDGIYSFQIDQIPDDPVGRLDCHLLEKHLYPLLKLDHGMILDPLYFDYYPESALGEMCQVVQEELYDIAVALHPVSSEELMNVAEAGLVNSEIVMPEKSTFFAPKILSGLFLISATDR